MCLGVVLCHGRCSSVGCMMLMYAQYARVSRWVSVLGVIMSWVRFSGSLLWVCVRVWLRLLRIFNVVCGSEWVPFFRVMCGIGVLVCMHMRSPLGRLYKWTGGSCISFREGLICMCW